MLSSEVTLVAWHQHTQGLGLKMLKEFSKMLDPLAFLTGQ